jgi:pimeloyl-ACP methyl ester carboxylesterase
MKLGKMLTGVGAVICTSLLGTALLIRPAVAQSSRPYVVFVNGWQNCCSWGMNALQNRLINQMNAEPRYVPYSNFDNNGSSGNTSTDERFLRDGADFINNQLDKNRPLILIGHSFGGDSVLKLLPRINRRIQLVAVIDPVRTGGFRATLKNLNVPSNVDYFYNRWQENEPFPTDYIVNGSIACQGHFILIS